MAVSFFPLAVRVTSVARRSVGCDSPRYESAPDERVDEPGDRPRRDLERFGKDTLGHRSALTQFPKQMGAGSGEVQRLDRLRHVVVQQNDELEHAIEYVFVLL
jgi:hypothetical protein